MLELAICSLDVPNRKKAVDHNQESCRPSKRLFYHGLLTRSRTKSVAIYTDRTPHHIAGSQVNISRLLQSVCASKGCHRIHSIERKRWNSLSVRWTWTWSLMEWNPTLTKGCRSPPGLIPSSEQKTFASRNSSSRIESDFQPTQFDPLPI